MFWDFVMDESDCGEILVHHRSKLVQTKRLDDVRGRHDADHASRGEPADRNPTSSGVSVLMKHQ
jgi:hypothetical protein